MWIPKFTPNQEPFQGCHVMPFGPIGKSLGLLAKKTNGNRNASVVLIPNPMAWGLCAWRQGLPFLVFKERVKGGPRLNWGLLTLSLCVGVLC